MSAYIVWGVLSLFYLFQFLLRIIINVINDQIIIKYAVDADAIGRFAGIWYVGYALFHIPVGLALDHLNPKKVVTSCIFITILGFIPIVYSNNFNLAILGRFFIGAGSSASALGAFKLLMIYFGEYKFPKMLGAMATIGLLGAALGTGPLEILIKYYGWHKIMILLMCYGCFTMLVCCLCLPNNLDNHHFSFILFLDDLKHVLSKYQMLLFCLFGGLLIGPLEGFADAWSNKYLRVIYHFTHETAGKITTMVYLGMSIGLIILGHIFEKTKSYYTLIITCGFALITSFSIIILQITHSVKVLMIIFFIMGFFSSYQIFILAKVMTTINRRYTTLMSAVANMIMMSCGFLFHRSIGKIIQHYNHIHINPHIFGMTVHIDSFFISFMMINIAMIIGTIGITTIAISEFIRKKKNKISCSLQQSTYI